MDKYANIHLLTGSKMPAIGLGTWKLTDNTADAIMHAFEAGYRMIDTSGDYGTQPGIGDGIKKSKRKRNEIYITTKVEETDDAYEATRKNLSELQLEHADLMLIHRPPKDGAGEELWEGLIRAKKEGLTKDIGVSNYSIKQIQALIDATGEVPVVNQIEWSPFGYSQAMLDFCKENGIIIQAYSPLTRGKRLNDEKLLEIAHLYNRSPAQLLIRWNVQLGTVPLPKANHAEHQDENINVFDFEITEDDMEALGKLNERYSSLGELPYE